VEPKVAELVEKELANAFEIVEAPIRQALARAVISALLEDVPVVEALAGEEAALRQGVVAEVEPLEAVVGRDAPATGRILFSAETNWRQLHALAQLFENENPNLRVEIVAPDWSYAGGSMFRSLDMSGTGQRADCFLYRHLQSPREAERVLPLDALLELEPDISRDDFYPVALNAFLYDGALVALPYEFQFPFMGYNTTLFDAAGVPYPQPGWTLHEFLETAIALTTREGREKQYGYVPFHAEFDALAFLYAFGVDLMDYSVEPPTARLDTAAVAEALRWYVALSETFGVKPVHNTNLYDYATHNLMEFVGERRTLLSTGRAAMWLDDGTDWNGLYPPPARAADEWGYSTLPVAPGARTLPQALATGLYISAETEQRQACWQWITFLTRQDPGGGVPAYIPVAESEEFRLRAGAAADLMLQTATQMGEQMVAQSLNWMYLPGYVRSPNWLNMQGWYQIALTRMLEEEISAEEALAATQAEFDAFYRCVVELELFGLQHGGRRLVECADPASPYVILGEE
jgi:ABC-type glycerol-3-phosphate transport system substrate-binding protein